MAIVKPFKALRPKVHLAEKVASPPYDVISSSEARIMVKDNPYSFLHVNKPEIDLDESIDVYSTEVYEKARENFKEFKMKGATLNFPPVLHKIKPETSSGYVK